MQIISFPSHYQLVYINLDISSSSLISYSLFLSSLLLILLAFDVHFLSFRHAFS